MKTRRLGGTGWEVSVISFGAIKLPQLSQKECDILLNRAIDLGINLVDTADCYGDSEEKIGKALSRRREEFYLSTKVDERDGSGVAKKLERCLRSLIFYELRLIPPLPPLGKGGRLPALHQHGTGPAGRQGGI